MTFLVHLTPGDGLSVPLCRVDILSPLATEAELHPTPGEAGLRIAGRIRLDRRAELIAELALPRSAAAPGDALLCLLAWTRWREQAIDHLHGDFAFVIWDGAQRQLFAARDRMGVRDIAWLRDGPDWWFADSLDELLAAAPARSRPLDRDWIATFLVGGIGSDPTATVYADVRRLAPGHFLTAQVGPTAADPVEPRRYWQLDPVEPLRLRSAAAYTEQFDHLLTQSLRDRLPAEGSVGIMLSGGMDSTTLAAKSAELIGPDRVFARSMVNGGDRDPEAAASREVAEFLGIRRQVVEMGPLIYDPEWWRKETSGAEPDYGITEPPAFTASLHDMHRQAAVWFYGEGPDNALTFEWRAWLRWLAGRRRWLTFAGACGTWLATKSLAEWKTTLAVWTGRKALWTPPPPMPWLRLEPPTDPLEPVAGSWCPEALANLRSTLWPDMCQWLDHLHAPAGNEWRHPYLDLRVLEFMLRAPPIPWGRNKRLLRQTMAGRLPETTLRRVKTPFYQSADLQFGSHVLPPMPRGGAIEEFVSLRDLPEGPAHPAHTDALIRVAVLDHWLRTHV